MNKLEKLTRLGMANISLNGQNLPPVMNLEAAAQLTTTINALIDHTHDFTSPAASDILNWEQSTTTPPIMETDKQ